ncbi:MAG: 2-hydroxy-3-oxopropionate reductase [Chloroflexi bacterium]|nr:2-hydroxy-3-oxopropionate reductase [Chloroflexota bacterium]
MSKPQIGFIGLGIMGRPMARNLLKAGYPLVVHNRSREPVQELVAAGAEEAFTPQEIAQRSQVIITMLPDSPDVELVALGPEGLIAGASEGDIYVDMSTIAPRIAVKVAAAMAEKGVRCLDAPVSGGDVGAINATLSIMVGGDAETFHEVRPIFEALGKTITLCGPNGAGQTVKACNQIQVALNIVGMAEALVLGAKAGVDPAIIVQVLSGGYAQSRVMDARGARVIRGDFQPGFRSRFHFKDLNIIMQTGNDYRVPLPVTSLVHELFAAMQAAGRGDLDHTGVITVLEDLAAVQARTKA